jgi:hypothetical protein
MVGPQRCLVVFSRCLLLLLPLLLLCLLCRRCLRILALPFQQGGSIVPRRIRGRQRASAEAGKEVGWPSRLGLLLLLCLLPSCCCRIGFIAALPVTRQAAASTTAAAAAAPAAAGGAGGALWRLAGRPRRGQQVCLRHS